MAVLLAAILRALHVAPRLLGCADHASDGGMTCFYGDVAGQRIATVGIGVAITALIWGLTFIARRDAKTPPDPTPATR